MFTTRLGGVSEGEFSTMNLSFTRGDRKCRVEENYRRIGAVLGCGPEDMVASHQTHTTNIRQVTAADRGKGITRLRDYEDIDGLITDVPGILLVTYFADCVPLFFVDIVHRAVGLAHSGWPSNCAACYEVGEDVAGQFSVRRTPGHEIVLPGRRQGKYQLDLWEANRQNLLAAGVKKERIAVTDICTCCNADYLFSHRASGGRRGNMGAFLGLATKYLKREMP